MRRLAAIAAIAVLGTLVVACAKTSSDGVGGGGGQGIRGVVLAGPQCPVETAESPCPPKPLGGVHVDVLLAGDVVAEATTDRDGTFSVVVDPGTYEVRATPGQQGFMSAKPVHVDVTDGAFVQVTVPVDTGIR